MDNIYKICNILQTTEFGIYQIWVSGDNTAYLNYFIFDGKFEAIFIRKPKTKKKLGSMMRRVENVFVILLKNISINLIERVHFPLYYFFI